MTPHMFPFRQIEKKWQEIWHQQKTYKVEDHSNKSKCYILEMLPYPSGKIHMGHVRNYSIGDAIARYKKALGLYVMHPMGWDAFGLPAENAAAEHNIQPAKWTYEHIEIMREQLLSLGFSYDWDREVATCHPGYYLQEQKIFLKFLEKNIAYQKESWVNWDPVENTVLANEQVIDGRGWRSNALVEKKKLRQWFLKITDYAEELLDCLETLKGWPEKVTKMQERWIGKSQGAIVKFSLVQDKRDIDVFTTRPDTLFGCSFIALSPSHPIVEEWSKTNTALADFVKICQQTPTSEEAISKAEKIGFDTGNKVHHPFIKDATIPVYVANFVLMEYGTGAVFGCPAHDERDFEFATKYHLPITSVIKSDQDLPYTGDGIVINSDFLNGLNVEDAKAAAIRKLEELEKGQSRTTYRLRDWGVSRQRYWGCPIPVVHCETCGIVPVPEDQLPILLPDNPDFSKPGNPLENHSTWKHTACPKCGEKAVRETDTLDTFFESSWYFLRYCCPRFDQPIDKKATDFWMDVDWYIGGIEHAVLHLLYARFFTKALRDCGFVSSSEPFKNLLTQGMVCHQTYATMDGKWVFPSDVTKQADGSYLDTHGQKVVLGRFEKMSKSKKNVIDPTAIIDAYGADVARFFSLSDSPPDKDFEWSDEGVEGCWRYLNRFWRLASSTVLAYTPKMVKEDATKELLSLTHRQLKNLTHAFDQNAFNKVIAFHRELTRALEEALTLGHVSKEVAHDTIKILIQTLAPLAPHIANELWQFYEKKAGVDSAWPLFDEALSKQQTIEIAVQVNGKMRGTFESSPDSSEDQMKEEAMRLPTVLRDLEGKTVRKYIVVKNRLVNIVAN